MADDAVFINHEGDAVGKEAGEAKDSIRLGNLLLGVAQKREARPGFFGELAVPILTVETDAQHLRARSLKLGDITLIRLDLLRSTGRGGANVKGQDNGFLPTEVREFDHLAVLIRQGKVRGAVTDLQSRRWAEQWHKE